MFGVFICNRASVLRRFEKHRGHLSNMLGLDFNAAIVSLRTMLILQRYSMNSMKVKSSEGKKPRDSP